MRYLWTRRSLPFVVILSFTYSEAEDDFKAFISAEPTAGLNTHAALAVLLDTAKKCESPLRRGSGTKRVVHLECQSNRNGVTFIVAG